MAESTLSVSIAAASGLLAAVGVTFQILEYRRRARADGTQPQGRPASAAMPSVATVARESPRGASPGSGPAAPTLGPDVNKPAAPQAPTAPSVPAPPARTPAPRPQPAQGRPPIPPPEPPYGRAPISITRATAVPKYPAPLPATVRRAQILLIVLTTLLVPGAIGFSLGLDEYTYSTTGEPAAPSSAFSVVLGLIASAPNVAILTVLSRFLGRGGRWAWVATLVVLPLQSLWCDFMGLGGLASLGDVSSASGVTGFVVMGISGMISGVLSLVTMSILLSNSARSYFRLTPS